MAYRQNSKKGERPRRQERKSPRLHNPQGWIDWIREKAPNTHRVSFWLRTEASGTEGALWFLLDVILTRVGNRFFGWTRRRARPGMSSCCTRRERWRRCTGSFLREHALGWKPPGT